MTADARAHAWCNLGPLAPGESSIGDDHVQGTGLCMTKGTIRLLGVVRPAAGTVVELAYGDGQSWLARLPRRLRVLSSFTNPLGTPITTVSVGCDLAYSESRKPVASNPTNTDANPTVPEVARRAASPPIPATWLVGNILQAIGITAAGACPLTNHYNLDEFNMSEGYVQELGKLLASEGYFARMNEAGLLEYISKDQGLQASIVLLEDDPIEINPVNSGELPGDGVYARFTSIRLKPPGDLNDQERAKRNWEEELTISGIQLHVQRWTTYQRVPVLDANGNSTYKQSRDRDGNLLYSAQTGNPMLEQVYETKAVQNEETIRYRTVTRSTTQYDGWDRVEGRTTETLGLWGLETSRTSYIYKRNYTGSKNNKPNNYSDIELERSFTMTPRGGMMMQLGANGSFFQIADTAAYESSARETRFYKNEIAGTTRTVNRNWVPYVSTTEGGEAISRMRDAGVPLENLYSQAIHLVENGSGETIRTEREYGLQRRPPEAARLADANKKTPEVEEVASLAWQMGSPASLTSVELSPPYVPDDRLDWSGSAWVLTLSDAPQKALNYARIENRLRLGHRNGLSLQLLPEQVPPVPFGLVFIRLAGCTAAYRLNGTTYTIGPDGCVASTDALFWGAIDGDGRTPWFPMPPDSSALPAPVAITANANPRPANAISIPQGFNPQAPNLTSLFASLPTGQAPTWGRSVNPSVLVRPYREAVDLSLGAGAGIVIDLLPWVAADPVDLLVGIGAGVDMAIDLLVGIGAGILIEVEGQAVNMAPLLSTIPANPNILDSSNLNPQSTSGLPYYWQANYAAEPMVIFTRFTLAQAITIVGVGIYDHGQNGLAQSHGFSLWNADTLQAVTLNYNNGVQQVTIPSGTAATLLGPYRVVPLVSSQTLQPGNYWMGTTMPTTGADAIAAIPEGAGVWNAAINNNSNSPTTTGWVFQYVAQSNPQVSFDILFDENASPSDYQFEISGGNGRVPIGPMLFVAA